MSKYEKSNTVKTPETAERLAEPGEVKLAADSALDLTIDAANDHTRRLRQDIEAFLSNSDFSYDKYGFPSPTEIIKRERGGARAARAFIQSRRLNEGTPAIVKLADEIYLRESGRKSQRSARSDEYLQTLLDDCKVTDVVTNPGENPVDEEIPDAIDHDTDEESAKVIPAMRLKPLTSDSQPLEPSSVQSSDTQSAPSRTAGQSSSHSKQPTPPVAIRITNPNQAPAENATESGILLDDDFIEDYKKQSQDIAKLRSELSSLRGKKDLYNRHLAKEKEQELSELEESFHNKFFNGIHRQDKKAKDAREKDIYEAMKAANERKINEVKQLKETVVDARDNLDSLILQYQSEIDPAKANTLWSQLEQAHTRYKEIAADFNLKNDVLSLSGLVSTPLFDAMGPAPDIVRATIRSDKSLRDEDAEYLHIPPTTTDKKAAAKAAKEAAKAQHAHDIGVLKEAVKEIPDWFSLVNASDDTENGTSKSDSGRKKQWDKLLKSFRDESHKYTKHDRGDALGSVYQIACQMERKWRGRDDFDSLTVADKEEYQKDMDRLLHDNDGFAWKVLGSNKINGRDLSISELYHVISRAEFKNTLRESRKRELGGVALMFATVPSALYQSSMALLTSVLPKADDLYWFIGMKNRQRTIDSLSDRTAKGLRLDSAPISTGQASAA